MKYKLKSEEKYNPFISTSIRDLIFKNRGIDNIGKYSNPTIDDLLDPYLLDNIKDGINLLHQHIHKENNIFLIVDSDVDGYTSAAIFHNYFTKAHPKIRLTWMVHAEKSHGINLDRIPEGTHLVVCPDSSSNEYDKHLTLKEQGIDILVIDHHEAPHYSDNATVINNQLSEHYPNKNLSGAGVMFKFCQAYDDAFDYDYAMRYLDLTAFGLVADMMDVREQENRYIIQEGLKNINNSFLQGLIQRQEFSLGQNSLNSIGIMFYIAPPLNAVTRVGSLEEREMLFTSFINGKKIIPSTKRGAAADATETVTEQAVRIAMNARARQKKLVDQIKEEIDADLSQQDLTNTPLILIKIESIPNRNLTGLIANQLASQYKRPVLLLVDQQDGSFSGSGRNYNYHELNNLKECLQDTTLFEFAEGHQSAFGAAIKEEQLDTFLEKLDTLMPEGNLMEDNYIVDFILQADDFSVDMIREITKLRTLWGKGFDEPLIAVENIPVNDNNFTIMGKNQSHIKFVHNDITYVKFWAKEKDMMNFEGQDVIVNVVGRCDVNIWNNNFSYQVIINDYMITDKGADFAF